MAQGGKRVGAGRKKGSKASHTIEASLARKELVSRVVAHIQPIANALIKKAEQGDVRAANVLFDRAFGRAGIEVTLVGDPVRPIIVFYGENDRLKSVMEKRNLVPPTAQHNRLDN